MKKALTLTALGLLFTAEAAIAGNTCYVEQRREVDAYEDIGERSLGQFVFKRVESLMGMSDEQERVVSDCLYEMHYPGELRVSGEEMHLCREKIRALVDSVASEHKMAEGFPKKVSAALEQLRLEIEEQNPSKLPKIKLLQENWKAAGRGEDKHDLLSILQLIGDNEERLELR